MFLRILLLLLACSCLKGPIEEPVKESVVVKWHPGHYYTIYPFAKNNPVLIEQYYSEMVGTSLKGMQIRYYWDELETKEGEYDFSQIETRLKEAEVKGKYLVIFVGIRSFDVESKLVPDYILSDKYSGGVFPYSVELGKPKNGLNIKLWNESVKEKFHLLIAEMGKKLNSHPNLEAIGFGETSLGIPIEALTKENIDGYYAGLLSLSEHAKKSFPNTIVYQFVNYPRSILPLFIETLEKNKVALGGPDIYIDDKGLLDGAYAQYPKLAGKVPLMPSVMQTNYYKATWGDKPGRVPTIKELDDFAKVSLQATHLFWTREKMHYQSVLDYLKTVDGLSDKAYPSLFK